MRVTLLALLCLVGILACDPSPQKQYERASREVLDARGQVVRWNAKKEERRAVLDRIRSDAEKRIADAEAALEDADRQLRAAQTNLTGARERVSRSASDELIFRAIQKLLLEDSKLKGAAVSATVIDGVVSLGGSAPSEELRNRAVRLAGETPGVSEVEDRIRVLSVDSEPKLEPPEVP